MPRRVARAVSLLVVVAWVVTMGVLLNRAYLQARSFNLATDLARYGSAAQWRGVYYRGEKIGFTVSQTMPTDDGFELQEDGRLQMSLLGADHGRGDPRPRRSVDRDVRAAVVRLLARSRAPARCTVSGRVDGLRRCTPRRSRRRGGTPHRGARRWPTAGADR